MRYFALWSAMMAACTLGPGSKQACRAGSATPVWRAGAAQILCEITHCIVRFCSNSSAIVRPTVCSNDGGRHLCFWRTEPPWPNRRPDSHRYRLWQDEKAKRSRQHTPMPPSWGHCQIRCGTFNPRTCLQKNIFLGATVGETSFRRAHCKPTA